MGYPEYTVATALAVLSTITQRKAYISLTTGDVYPNLIQNVLGLSSISKKSTITKQCRKFIYDLGKELLIPGNPASSSAHYQDIEGRIRCDGHDEWIGKGLFFRDEAGGFFHEIQKSHFPGIKDFICEIYDCTPFYRTYSNIGKKAKDKILIDIPSPFVNYLFVTTPDKFAATTNGIDISSGFLVRALYYLPMYERPFKPIGSPTPADLTRYKNLMGRYETIMDLFAPGEGFEVEFILGKPESDVYNQWLKMHHERLHSKDVTEGEREHFARLSITALKLAMLYQIGDPKFIDDVTAGRKLGSIRLDKKYLEIAIQICDDYYLPTALYVMSLVGKNEEKNDLDKAMGILKRNGGIMRRRDLMRAAHFKDRDTLGKILDALEYAEEIITYNDPKNRIGMLAVPGHPQIPEEIYSQ